MRLSKGHMILNSSDDWMTPDWILARAREAFGGRIDLDPCGNLRDHVDARKRIMPPENGLLTRWHGRVWVNPPFGRSYQTKLDDWYHKAWIERNHGAEILLLVPAFTDSTAFQFYVPRSDGICFIRGRLSFRRTDGNPDIFNAAASHAVISFGVTWRQFKKGFDGVGWIPR